MEKNMISYHDRCKSGHILEQQTQRGIPSFCLMCLLQPLCKSFKLYKVLNKKYSGLNAAHQTERCKTSIQ